MVVITASWRSIRAFTWSRALPACSSWRAGVGHGGLHLGSQGLVLQADLVGPLGHLLVELAHLALGLVLDQLGPAVGVQLQPGGPLLQGGIGLGVRL